MDLSYLLTPFVAWFAAGVTKFLINTLRDPGQAMGLIGYGGMPSNHSTIVCSMAALIALKEGFAHPAFGVAVTLAFIVMLDAGGLRRHVARQAQALNRLAGPAAQQAELRERIGHSRLEILAGVVLGVAVAVGMHYLTR